MIQVVIWAAGALGVQIRALSGNKINNRNPTNLDSSFSDVNLLPAVTFLYFVKFINNGRFQIGRFSHKDLYLENEMIKMINIGNCTVLSEIPFFGVHFLCTKQCVNNSLKTKKQLFKSPVLTQK